jgi:hypothetical protein
LGCSEHLGLSANRQQDPAVYQHYRVAWQLILGGWPFMASAEQIAWHLEYLILRAAIPVQGAVASTLYLDDPDRKWFQIRSFRISQSTSKTDEATEYSAISSVSSTCRNS